MRKILVTGGGGLIGQAIAKLHLEHGDSVYIYDTKINTFNDYSNLYGIDITEKYSSIEEFLQEIKPDIISNQAALVGVGQSQYDISRYTENNVMATARLLQAILNTKIFPTKFLHAGSMGPYGETGYEIITEDTKLHPASIYGATKLAQEELVRVFSESYKMDSISLRYFSVYSTNQTPLNPYTGILSIIANQCLNADVISLYEDGNQTRDMVHVVDIAKAHYLASNHRNATPFLKLNIGAGISTPVWYMAEQLRNRISPGKQIVYSGLRRVGDIRTVFTNPELANKVLGWKSTISIDHGISVYADYISQNRAKYTSENTVLKDSLLMQEKGLLHK